MKKQILTTVVTLAIGLAAGYLAHPVKYAEKPDEKKAEPQKKAEVRVDDGASVKALRSRVRELERELMAARNKTAEPAAEKVEEGDAEPRPQEPRGWGNFDFRAEMERVRKEMPERFAQATNFFAQARQRRQEHARSRLDFLSSISTAGMNAGERKVHEDLQKLIVRRDELEEQMRNLDLSNEERMQLFSEMRETDHQMRQLNGQERENLIKRTAENLGFQGEEVGEIAQTLQEIINATEGGGRHGSFGGFGGPGGPGGGRGWGRGGKR